MVGLKAISVYERSYTPIDLFEGDLQAETEAGVLDTADSRMK